MRAIADIEAKVKHDVIVSFQCRRVCRPSSRFIIGDDQFRRSRHGPLVQMVEAMNLLIKDVETLRRA